ncbi:DUF1918 domain-containing protein [Streptomyces durmitorensis]|uniref:DUF1918 domain-containing protein n=1 Tax=Streptomyces durmitorensis TaxID=319947 RepID=A0ABY4PWY5_9ACTN|nr:DUF1918 domain-containing protein [Streptomyces durmitorensis]UQT57388.1 DUF1918 domain-containing protein [Streptomyces durmitorensis]
MPANVGDEVVMQDRASLTSRSGKITEVLGADGAPPYLVRFTDGSEQLVSPGPDIEIASTFTESE